MVVSERCSFAEGQNPEAREDPQEFQELALSAGAEIVSLATVARHQPTAKYLIGSGKVEELRDLVHAEQVDLVIFNHTLTPSQERNLERVFECRVLDRTGLILTFSPSGRAPMRASCRSNWLSSSI